MCCSIIGENEKTLTALIFGSDSCPGRVPICGLPLVAGGWHDATLRTSLFLARRVGAGRVPFCGLLSLSLSLFLAGRVEAGRVPFCGFLSLSLSRWLCGGWPCTALRAYAGRW